MTRHFDIVTSAGGAALFVDNIDIYFPEHSAKIDLGQNVNIEKLITIKHSNLLPIAVQRQLKVMVHVIDEFPSHTGYVSHTCCEGAIVNNESFTNRGHVCQQKMCGKEPKGL